MLNRKIAYVDLTSGNIEIKDFPPELRTKYLGGRGVNAYLLNQMVQPDTDPLGPDNPLIVGVGLLTGTPGFGTARTQFSARSPESGYLGDSSMGGEFGPELSFAGFSHLVITGQSPEPVYLWVTNDKIEIRSAKELWGKGTLETLNAIKSRERNEWVKAAVIGVAGENRVRFANIITGPKDSAGRTGMGAVMGSKRLKAIAVRGTKDLKIADPQGLIDYLRGATRKLAELKWVKGLGHYGTPVIFVNASRVGLFTARNHQEAIDDEYREKLHPENLEPFKKGMAACYSCIVHCRDRHYIDQGPYAGTRGEGPELAGLGAFGTNLGSKDLATVVYASDLCNKYGLDVVSTGTYVGWAMELYQRGIITKEDLGYPLEWGNPESVISLIEDIAHSKGFGDILADGAMAAPRLRGDAGKYLMRIKGMPVLATDERAIKSFALGIAVSTRGADHLRSRPAIDLFRLPEDFLESLYGGHVSSDATSYDGKGRMIWWQELLFAVTDAIGICKFQTVFNSPHAPKFEEFSELIRLTCGLELSPRDLMEAGERIYTTERLYLNKMGLGRQDDTLPDRYFDEPVDAPLEKGAHIDRERFEAMLDEYYAHHGWDAQGRPTEATLHRLGIA
jgi:aldehyde:ferredoxin oxidoreductase